MLRHSMLLLTVELCRLVVQHFGRFAEKKKLRIKDKRRK